MPQTVVVFYAPGGRPGDQYRERRYVGAPEKHTYREER